MKGWETMEYFLGVDAGGSKTIGVLVNARGELVATRMSGPANLVENGEEMVRRNIGLLATLLEGLHVERIYSAFGMPAFGESLRADMSYLKIITEELGIQPTLLVNDVVVGWAGGTLGQDGVHIVAGTGTIAYGRCGRKEARTSGWGSIIGDEGSAYDLGRETLRRVSRQLDGRETPTLLKEMVFERLGLSSWQSLTEWVYSLKEIERRTTIASLATVTYEAARNGDLVARAILKNAAWELSLCVLTLIEKLLLPKPLVTFSGSVLEKNEIIRESFVNHLKRRMPEVVVRNAAIHPALGAVILLYRETNREISEGVLYNLQKASQRLLQDEAPQT